jgi:hypothetical protein
MHSSLASILPYFISVLTDKLFEKRCLKDALIRLLSCFTESPVDGAYQGALTRQRATAIGQDNSPFAPDIVADLPELFGICSAHY